MKHTLVALCAVLLLAGCSTDKDATQSAFDFKEFLDPGASYRSAPFYSLNDSLSADEITRQIGLMKQGGFGGVFLHSRTGLLTPYLSDEWFKMMDAGVKACQDNGMEAWFYDEDKWPSGFAGGIIPRMNDAFRACTMGRMPLDYEMTPDDTLLMEDGRYKYVAQRDAMGQSWYNGTCWVDLMNPAMVDAFIECSYRPYVERYSGMKGVKGIFTDEPQVSARPMPGSDGRISYSPVMDSVFTAMWGYDIKEALPGLFEEVGQWRKARLHYYSTVARCMDEAFSNRIGAYCAQNGLIWTGHYNAEQSPRGSMQNEGDLMLQLRRMQAPGMDALGLRLEDIHNDKVCSSVANQYGITRRLCEVFGISGHNMDFEDRMWLTAYHTIMGINFMCPHLYLYSMKGERKRDFPPTLSHQQPYWGYNKLFEDFSGRLCYVASVGRPVGDVCVLTPQETYYLAEPPVGMDRASFKDWNYDMDPVLRTLFKGQMNPDLGNEQIIEEEGSVDGNIFRIGKMDYKAVMMPSLITIRLGTIELLEQFVAGGGVLFSCGMMPRLVDGEEDAEALARLESITQSVTLEELSVKVREATAPMVEIAGDGAENIWLAVRSVDGGYTVQLSNISRHQGVKATLSIADKSATLALWNPVDGSGQRLERESDGTLRLDFDPAQTWVMTIGNEALANGASGTYSTQGEKVEVGRLEGRWAMRRLDPNAIPLDFARWSTDGTQWHEAEPVLALYTRWCSEPYDGPLWLEYSFDAELLPKVCGVAVEQPHIYNSISINGHELSFVNAGHYIDHTFRTADIARYLQQGTNRILLQLDNVSARRTSSDAIERYGSEIETIYIFGDFGVKSELAAEQPTSSWRNRRPILPQKPLPASFAHGTFSLSSEPDSVGRNITLEGYPFYAGAVELSRRFVVPAAGGNGRVLLDFRGTEAIVINVSVNGVEMPPVYSSPWQCDITDALCDGENDLKVTLVGSLRNLMGPYHNAGAEFCGVGPATFTGADDWPQEEKGDALWYEARKGGKALLWRDNYYCIPFGIMQSPRILVQR